MDSKKQVLFNMRSGDRVLFDIETYEEFESLSKRLPHVEWLEVGNTSVLRVNEILSLYYLPEGYDKKKASGHAH